MLIGDNEDDPPDVQLRRVRLAELFAWVERERRPREKFLDCAKRLLLLEAVRSYNGNVRKTEIGRATRLNSSHSRASRMPSSA